MADGRCPCFAICLCLCIFSLPLSLSLSAHVSELASGSLRMRWLMADVPALPFVQPALSSTAAQRNAGYEQSFRTLSFHISFLVFVYCFSARQGTTKPIFTELSSVPLWYLLMLCGPFGIVFLALSGTFWSSLFYVFTLASVYNFAFVMS